MQELSLTQKVRYWIALKIIEKLTPNLYYKLRLLRLTGNIYSPYIESNTPRPSILFMKKYFNNKSIDGTEIGVFVGKNAKSILKELNINRLYLIDIWDDYIGNPKGYSNIGSREFQIVCNKFKHNSKVEIIRDFSENAVKQFKDNSLDFVYIDANHTYKYVYQDISLWYNKIKEKGVISGHDVYNDIDVLHAVKDFCINKGITFKVKLPDWYFIK